MWDSLMAKILLFLLGLVVFYILVRVAFLAIFKSWVDAHKTIIKEDKNVIQKKSGEV